LPPPFQSERFCSVSVFDRASYLPDGRGNARCSAFHPTDPAFEPSLHQHKSLPAGNAILRGRDKGPERALEVQLTVCRDKMRARIPASSGLFTPNREISVCLRLRGGAERTRTACQARSSVERVSNTSRLIIVWLEVRVLSAFAIERRFSSSLRKAPNWRGFVHAFCLCKRPIGFEGSYPATAI
jgi:hypothetical protein